MIWLSLAAPLVMMLVLVVLERLEDFVVAPVDRAVTIERLLSSSSADEIEERVSAMLAPVAGRRERALEA